MRQVWRLLLLLVAVSGCCRSPLFLAAGADVPTQATIKSIPSIDNSASCLIPVQIQGDPNCCSRIALIDVDGMLLNRNLSGLGSMGENPVGLFREKLQAAARDPSVCAVVLRINSPGGGVTASDIMRRDIEQFKCTKNVPIVACLMDVGTGGAYYMASACDVIIAHPTTITGGIGVILNVYNLQDTMAQYNVLGTPVKAGENIDLGSPVKYMTPESRQLLQKLADEFHQRFCDLVVQSRGLPSPLPSNLCDGRILTAQEALEFQLIDGIGYLDDAVRAAQNTAGLSDQASLVMYRRTNDRALSPYDITPNIPLQNSLIPVSLPGLDRSQLPTFLYLWQPEPSLERTGGS